MNGRLLTALQDLSKQALRECDAVQLGADVVSPKLREAWEGILAAVHAPYLEDDDAPEAPIALVPTAHAVASAAGDVVCYIKDDAVTNACGIVVGLEFTRARICLPRCVYADPNLR